MKQHYTTLGLQEGASQDEIQAAYKRLSKELDPANNDNQDFFVEEYQKLQDAHKALRQSSILKNSDSSSGAVRSNRDASSAGASPSDPSGSFTVTISPEKIEELKNKTIGLNSEQSKQYKGVGGWLLLLCCVLTIFSPLGTLANLIASYEESALYFDVFPGIKKVIYIDTFLSILLMIKSVRAGIALWSVKPGAVKTAKNYFLIFTGYCIVVFFLPFTAGLPSEANDVMLLEGFFELIKSSVFFGIWYSYLNVSKRVKATYIQ